MVAFASNDYLGLANHPALIAATRAAAQRFGVGAGASHLVAGHFASHATLETELAAFAGPCANARALTFSSGYLANIAILTALAGRGDVIFGDRLNHACLNDGALLARADFVRYAHCDVAALRARLATSKARRKLIATDAVFSMDGDLAPLPALLELADEFDAWLVVDDAHGFGVLGEGRGSVGEFRLTSERIVLMGTMGKAAGVAGAFVTHIRRSSKRWCRPRACITTTAARSPRLFTQAWQSSATTRRGAHLAALIEQFRERRGCFHSRSPIREPRSSR